MLVSFYYFFYFVGEEILRGMGTIARFIKRNKSNERMAGIIRRQQPSLYVQHQQHGCLSTTYLGCVVAYHSQNNFVSCILFMHSHSCWVSSFYNLEIFLILIIFICDLYCWNHHQVISSWKYIIVYNLIVERILNSILSVFC